VGPAAAPAAAAPTATAAATAFGTNSEGGAGGTAGRPLKVNRDLRLYEARRLRQLGDRTPGGKARKARSYARAEALFREVMAMDPTDGRSYVGLGKLLLSQRRADEARAVYQAGCDNTGGENAYIWQSWGVLEARQGHAKEARKLFDAATVADPAHAGTWHSWGNLEERQGNPERARDLYIRGLKFSPAERPPQYLLQSLALLASRNGRVPEARAWFERSLDLNEDQPSMWESWGSMEARLGNEEEARQYFQNALSGSNSRYAWLSWGRWETRWGNHQTGRDILKVAHRRYPADVPIIQALALAEAELGRVEVARGLFVKATRRDARHQPSWQAWAMLEWEEGAVERARELFQQGVWAEPTSKDVVALFKAWGDLEASQANVNMARAMYQCAVRADVRSKRSWYALAELEETEGNIQMAEELRATAEEIMKREVDSSVEFGPSALDEKLWTERFSGEVKPRIRAFLANWKKAVAESNLPTPDPAYVPSVQYQGSRP